MAASPALASIRTTQLPAAAHAPDATLPGDIAGNRNRGGWSGGFGGGFGGGWGGGRRHHGDGIDAGDVFAGVLILGTIAAVASAASKSKREREDDTYRYPNDGRSDGGARYPSDSRPSYGERSADQRGWDQRGMSSSRGIDSAVDACVAEVERTSAPVDTVEGVDRDGGGWRVEGKLRNGSPFNCSVDGELRIRGLNVNGGAPFRN